jgi:hypothetical protein
MAKIRVLSPVGEVLKQTLSAPRLPGDLHGRTVGFLDNTKSNFDRLTEEMGALLRERYGVKAVLRLRKANAATPAAPGILAELAKQCDVVFAGSAD